MSFLWDGSGSHCWTCGSNLLALILQQTGRFLRLFSSCLGWLVVRVPLDFPDCFDAELRQYGSGIRGIWVFQECAYRCKCTLHCKSGIKFLFSTFRVIPSSVLYLFLVCCNRDLSRIIFWKTRDIVLNLRNIAQRRWVSINQWTNWLIDWLIDWLTGANVTIFPYFFHKDI